jgi:hypothetical protein
MRGSTVVRKEQVYQDTNQRFSNDGFEGESYYGEGESEETITEIVGEDVIELESEQDVENNLIDQVNQNIEQYLQVDKNEYINNEEYYMRD